MPEQLVAAADGEHSGTVVDRRRERLALGLDHVPGDQALIAVLAATDVDQVVGPRIEALAGPGDRMVDRDPAPFAAPAQEEDVPAVGVDVHLLRVEGEQAKLHQPTSRTQMVEPT